MNGFVYILRLNNGKYYIGSTVEVHRRVSEHEKGKVIFTKNNRPFKLIFTKEFEDIILARKKEFWLKKQKSRKFIEDFISAGPPRDFVA